MIYELKRYVPHAGREQALQERFATKTLPVFHRLGIDVIHCWTCAEEPGVFYYLCKFANEALRVQAWAAFGGDAEWQDVKAASEADGPLLAGQTRTLLQPTTFSPEHHD